MSSAAPSDSPHRYSKEFRLRKHADYDRVYKQGRRHFSQLMTFFYLQPETHPPHPRVGITVGRALGGAVARNRIKRRMREAVRLNLAPLVASALPMDIVINPKKSVLSEDFARISAEVARGFQQILSRSASA